MPFRSHVREHKTRTEKPPEGDKPALSASGELAVPFVRLLRRHLITNGLFIYWLTSNLISDVISCDPFNE